MFKTATSLTVAMKLLSLLRHAASKKTMHALEEMSVKISQRSESMLHKTSKILTDVHTKKTLSTQEMDVVEDVLADAVLVDALLAVE